MPFALTTAPSTSTRSKRLWEPTLNAADSAPGVSRLRDRFPLAAGSHELEDLPGGSCGTGVLGHQDVDLAREVLAEAQHVVVDPSGGAVRHPQLLHQPQPPPPGTGH